MPRRQEIERHYDQHHKCRASQIEIHEILQLAIAEPKTTQRTVSAPALFEHPLLEGLALSEQEGKIFADLLDLATHKPGTTVNFEKLAHSPLLKQALGSAAEIGKRLNTNRALLLVAHCFAQSPYFRPILRWICDSGGYRYFVTNRIVVIRNDQCCSSKPVSLKTYLAETPGTLKAVLEEENTKDIPDTEGVGDLLNSPYVLRHFRGT